MFSRLTFCLTFLTPFFTVNRMAHFHSETPADLLVVDVGSQRLEAVHYLHTQKSKHEDETCLRYQVGTGNKLYTWL